MNSNALELMSQLLVLKAKLPIGRYRLPKLTSLESGASRFHREASATVARIYKNSYSLSDSSHRVCLGYVQRPDRIHERKPTARKRSLSLADIRAKDAANKAGIRLRLSAT